MNICDLKPGEKGLIENITGDEKLAKRLLALGCIEGTEVSVKTSAPFGDPLIINLRGFNLAIRKKDAKNILISNKDTSTNTIFSDTKTVENIIYTGGII